MLTIDFIRENREKVITAAKNKGREISVDKIIELDNKRREFIQQIEKLRQGRNSLARPDIDENQRKRAKEIKQEIPHIEAKLNEIVHELSEFLLTVPNMPLAHVPVGNESKNKVIKTVGEPKKFEFTPLDHMALGENFDIIDVSTASKISGSRFAYLKNEAVLLELALIQFVMRKLVTHGFTPIIPPALIKKHITDELGYWNGKDTKGVTLNENYYLVKDYDEGRENDLYLIGTGEHSVVPMYSDTILEEKQLPLKFAAFSPCFRREAGAGGKDTHGILRVHQFEKVEMVAFTTPEQDETERKKMLSIAEEILTELELPYQVVQLATGDLSLPAAETIDIETWIPSQNKYRETHSISTTTDFQARRLKTRFKSKPTDPTKFVHILNGTALALGRIIIAILENNQQADGSVKIPPVLHPFTGFSEIRKK